MDGVIRGVAVILGGRHHRLELLEVDTTIRDAAFIDETLEVEAIEREVELRGRDEAIFVAVVEIEGITELTGSTVGGGIGAAKGDELHEVDEVIAVSVEVFHDMAEVLWRDVRSERPEHAVELVSGDLAVAVGVEAVEDCLEFVHVFEIQKELVFKNLKFTFLKIEFEILFF